MRIAVTGASGFVGGAIATWLAERGHDVVGYGRRPRSALATPIEQYVEWDVGSGAIDGGAVDAVVHCAAHVGQWGGEAPYRRVNVDGTRHVLESFPHAPRFIHLSTSSVYSGAQPKVRVREGAPVGQGGQTPYARTKAEGEAIVRASGRDAIILRPHIVYGPGDTTLWPKVQRARRLGWLPVPGTGENRISVTHVYNLAIAVECALRAPPHAGSYNISDGEDATVDELLRIMLQRRKLAARLLYIPRAVAWGAAVVSEVGALALGRRREPTLTRYVVQNLADEHTLDITSARVMLHYAPRYTFREGPLDG